MYQPITTLTDAQITQLHKLYQQVWWSRDRTLPDVQRMLHHSDFLFGFCTTDSQQLVAFARVLSDRVYRALVFDVIVAAEYRNQGLGLALIEQIVTHPELSQVECIQLFCLPDMIPFYQKFGFVQSDQSLLIRRASQ